MANIKNILMIKEEKNNSLIDIIEVKQQTVLNIDKAKAELILVEKEKVEEK